MVLNSSYWSDWSIKSRSYPSSVSSVKKHLLLTNLRTSHHCFYVTVYDSYFCISCRSSSPKTPGSPKPASPPGTPSAGGAAANVVPPRQQQPQAAKKKQRPKKKKGGWWSQMTWLMYQENKIAFNFWSRLQACIIYVFFCVGYLCDLYTKGG